jgi:glycine/D-amino acid oxidase-like deaminating enzyme
MLNLPDVEKSYWKQAYLKAEYPRLKEDIKVDTVIVGGGITGLTSAYLLKQAGQKVAVLEKRTIGAGTSGRTTGKVTSQHNLVYQDLAKQHGDAKALLYGQANQAAVEQVRAIVKAEKIVDAWFDEDNYIYTEDPRQINTFKREAEVAASFGLPASFETATPLPFEVRGAVKFSGQGRIHSLNYLTGLAKAVNGEGSYVFENSHVIGIHDGSQPRVRTRRAKAHAKNIIVATNVPTLPLIARPGYCLMEYPTESYLVAGRGGRKLNGMYISPDKQLYSILPVGDMILVGGEGHLPVNRTDRQDRLQRLADFAEDRLGVTSIEYKWSDRDYMAYDGMPLFGKLYPWSRHLYVATAFKKWGLSNGTAAGMILRDTIMGVKNPWAEAFNTMRAKPIASIPKVAWQYLAGGG